MDPTQIIEENTNAAWQNLPPAAAALFIVLVLVLVGGIWLATTYMRTYGTRTKVRKPPEPESIPKEPSKPGPKTLWSITRQSVDQERARERTDERILQIDKRIDEINKQLARSDKRTDDLFAVEGRHHQALDRRLTRIESKLDGLPQSVFSDNWRPKD